MPQLWSGDENLSTFLARFLTGFLLELESQTVSVNPSNCIDIAVSAAAVSRETGLLPRSLVAKTIPNDGIGVQSQPLTGTSTEL